jgi:hypothetical protein
MKSFICLTCWMAILLLDLFVFSVYVPKLIGSLRVIPTIAGLLLMLACLVLMIVSSNGVVCSSTDLVRKII